MARRPTKRGRSSAPQIKALDLRANLEAEGPRPCYLLLGPESYLQHHAVEVLKDVLLGNNMGPSFQEYDGKKLELAPVLDELRTMPFLGTSHRLVVVSNGGGQQGFVARHGEALAPFLENPPSTSTLVICAKKLDKRLKATKALLKAVKQIDCSPFDEAAMLRFVRERAKHWGRPFARRADFALLEQLGGQDVELESVDAEVRKLATAADTGEITAEEVLALASSGSSEQAFGLIDQIARGDLKASLTRLQRMFRDGMLTADGSRVRDSTGIAMILLPTIRWDLSRLLKARALLEDGLRPNDVTKQLRVFRNSHAFVERVRRADREELGRRHAILREADTALRSSANPENTLLLVVTKLTLSERVKRRAG